MKHIKLFEAFISENYTRDSVKFGLHDLYQMPSGLSRDKVYLVKFIYECSNLIYALMDYSQLEKTYELLNLNYISEKIQWYSWMIYSDHPLDPLSAQYYLTRKSWSINILAQAKGEEFPYYVYIHGGGEPFPIMKKLKDLQKKDCEFCGADPPEVKSLIPGDIQCALGSDIAVFDPEMGMELSDIIVDDSGTHDPPDNDDHIHLQKGFYIRFDSLGAHLLLFDPAFSDVLQRFVNDEKYIVDNSKIFESLEYKPTLFGVRETIFGKEGARNFLDDIFAYLIDEDTPQSIIKEISNILNPNKLELETLDYYRVELHHYQKKILSLETGERSETADLRRSRFFLALPNDLAIVRAIMEKLPKDYAEISDGLDSLDPSVLQKYKDNYGTDFTNLENYKEILKYSIYLVERNSATNQKINLYDGKLPSEETLVNETKCHFFYGIFQPITLDKINQLSPIELYLDIFYNRKRKIP